VASLPQVAPTRLGVVFVLAAATAIVPVPPDDAVSPCVPAAPLGGPEIKDIVQGKVRQEWTCATPLRRPFLLLSPVPILQHAWSADPNGCRCTPARSFVMAKLLSANTDCEPSYEKLYALDKLPSYMVYQEEA
jgi:hypothetical protein